MFLAVTSEGEAIDAESVDTREKWAEICKLAKAGGLKLHCRCESKAVPVSRHYGYGRHRATVRFFRHPPRKSDVRKCPSAAQETPLHSALKACVLQTVRARGLEAWLERRGEGFVADVLFRDSTTTRTHAVEIQLSPQIAIETMERTRRRRAASVTTVWLFGKRINVTELPDEVHADPVVWLKEKSDAGKLAEARRALEDLLDSKLVHMTADQLKEARGFLVVAAVACAGCGQLYTGTFGAVIDLSRLRADWGPKVVASDFLNHRPSWVPTLLAKRDGHSAVRWRPPDYRDAELVCGFYGPRRGERPRWLLLMCPHCGLAHPEIPMAATTLMKAPVSERIPIRFPTAELVERAERLAGWRLKPVPSQEPVTVKAWHATTQRRLTEHRAQVAAAEAFRKGRARRRQAEFDAYKEAIAQVLPVDFDKKTWFCQPRFDVYGRSLSLHQAMRQLDEDAWRSIASMLRRVGEMLLIDGSPEVDLLGLPIEHAQERCRRLWARKQRVLKIDRVWGVMREPGEPQWSSVVHPKLGRTPIQLIEQESDERFDNAVTELEADAQVALRRYRNRRRLLSAFHGTNEPNLAQLLEDLGWQRPLDGFLDLEESAFTSELSEIRSAYAQHLERKAQAAWQSSLAADRERLRKAAARAFAITKLAEYWLSRPNPRLAHLPPEQSVLRGVVSLYAALEALQADSVPDPQPDALFERLVVRTARHYRGENNSAMALQRTVPQLGLRPKDVATTEVGVEWVLATLEPLLRRNRR
ncbi:hypothetical protein [Thalassobaculum sp.]|uniref:hypothetical protein n=1 Tax=Thalassobaculum sp. TaxID=2022740 RepID=UPI0032EEBAEB